METTNSKNCVEVSSEKSKTVDCRTRSLKKAFFKIPRWVYGKMKTNKNRASDTELKIKGEYILAMKDYSEFVKSDSQGSIEEKTDNIGKMDDRNTTDMDLNDVMTVVSMMHKDNKRMEKELDFLKKGQLSAEQKLQAIQEFHAVIMSNKDPKYDRVVKELKALRKKELDLRKMEQFSYEQKLQSIQDSYATIITKKDAKYNRAVKGLKAITENELDLRKKEQLSFEQKMQAIQDSHAEIISKKDARYDMIVKNLKAETEKELNLLKKGQFSFEKKLQRVQDSHEEIMLNKDAKHDRIVKGLKALVEKELDLRKKDQLYFEQKLQTIQDSHEEIILSKDVKYDLLVKELKALTEMVTKTTKDVVNLSKSENESKKKLDYGFDRIQERDYSVSMRLIDLKLLILKSVKKQNADYNRLEKYLELSMKLGIKNSTDNVNCDAKIEELFEKTVAVGVSQKNVLIDAKRIVGEEIYSLKPKSAMVECRCNKKENHINTDIKNMKLKITKDLSNMEEAIRDIEKNRKLQNEKADQHNQKYEKLKTRLSTFEKNLQNKSEQFTQNKLIKSTSGLTGRNYQPNDVHETEVKSASISPRAQPSTSPSPLCPMPPTASPSARPQEQKYSNYIITDDLLNDMHKQLSGEEIGKIPKHTDKSIPCRPVAILPKQGSEPLLPESASQLTLPASPFPSPAPLSSVSPPAPLSLSSASPLPQSPQFETTSS